jgi:hypothetical protein
MPFSTPDAADCSAIAFPFIMRGARNGSAPALAGGSIGFVPFVSSTEAPVMSGRLGSFRIFSFLGSSLGSFGAAVCGRGRGEARRVAPEYRFWDFGFVWYFCFGRRPPGRFGFVWFYVAQGLKAAGFPERARPGDGDLRVRHAVIPGLEALKV